MASIPDKVSAIALILVVLIVSLLTLAVWAAGGESAKSFALAGSDLKQSGDAPDNVIYLDLPDARDLEIHESPMGQVVEIDGYETAGSPGAPQLPYRTLRVLMPPDVDWVSLKVEVIEGEWRALPGEYDLAPAPPAATEDEGKQILDWGKQDVSRLQAGRDLDIYEANADYPPQPLHIQAVGAFRQYRIVTLLYSPFSYNPMRGALQRLEGARAALRFERLRDDSLSASGRGALDRFWGDLPVDVANASAIKAYYGAKLGRDSAIAAINDYVVITTAAIRANSGKLNAFIQSKTSMGHTVKVVVEGGVADGTHYASGTSADQRADNIRQWLVDRYMSESIEYVLLIGNPNPTAFDPAASVPMKMCYPRHDSGSFEDSPTDLYFGDLTGNWDLDGDGYYGEASEVGLAGGIDRLSEVKVGRIPFYGSYGDLDAILAKFVAYAEAEGDQSWRQRALFAAAISNHAPQDENADGDATDSGEYRYAAYRTFGDDWGQELESLASARGLIPYTLYEKAGVYADGSAYPLATCNAPLNSTNLLNAWQNGYGFVAWWGHGNSTASYQRIWTHDTALPTLGDRITQHPQETSSLLFMQSADTASLPDGRPSFVVQVSCHNGRPETSGNLGYSLLRQGAIGTVSASRVSWYRLGAWQLSSAGSYGDNASYAYYILQRMFQGDSAGHALASCRAEFGLGWGGSSWMNCTDMNLYGDPSLVVSTGAEPPAPTPTATVGVQCTAARAISCGEVHSWNNGGAGSTNRVDSYSCSSWTESGPEYAYSFVPSVSGNVTVRLDLAGMSADLDIFVLDETGGACRANACLAYDNDSATFYAVAGRTYYLVVDGFYGAVSDYTLMVSCSNTPTATATPTATPMTGFTWYAEVENGYFTAPLAPAHDNGASSCQYLYTDQEGSGVANLSIQVPATGLYFVSARAMGRSWSENSFYFSVDGGNETIFDVPPVSGQWTWTWRALPAYVLSAGAHTLRFRGREPNSRLDAIWVTDSGASPPSIAPCDPTGPRTVSVDPRDGWSLPGEWQTFTVVYSDSDGWDDLRYVDLMVNEGDDLTYGVVARYDVFEDLLYLHHATKPRWLPTGITPGAPGILEHIYGGLNAGASSVLRQGNNLTVTWSVRFSPKTSGQARRLYLRAEDSSGKRTGWNMHGNWVINRMPNWLVPPDLNRQVLGLQEVHWFNLRYRDLDRKDNLKDLYFLIADEMPNGSIRNAVYLWYDCIADRMYLRDVNDSVWLGGVTPRTSFRVENPLVALRGPGSRVATFDYRTLTVKWVLEFKPAFQGRHKLYMRAVDKLGAAFDGDTGWKWKGWIEIQ